MTVTRRDVLKLGAGVGAGIALGLPLGSLEAQEGLIMATIPSTGEKVPAVGIGTRNYRVALDSPDLATFRGALQTFHAMGGRVVDTSPNYGNSEEVVGHLLGDLGIRDDVFLATKVDQRSKEAGVRRMEASFQRLGGTRIDLMQVHNLIGADTQLETLKAWKAEGRIRYVGVTTSSERQYDELERLMRAHDLDFIQVDYALDNREADKRILPLAQDRGVAALVNLPFGRGRLFRATAGVALPDWAADIDAESWAQVFLKYIVSHPGTTIPIPGTTKPEHARDNIGAARGRLPDAALRRRMEAFADAL